MEQVDNLNEYASNLLKVAAAAVMNNPIVGIAIVVVGANGAKMANTVALNGYEMAGILQSLSVTSCLAAQKSDAEAAQQAQQNKLYIPN